MTPGQPCAVKAAGTVWWGGWWKRTVGPRALSLPNADGGTAGLRGWVVPSQRLVVLLPPPLSLAVMQPEDFAQASVQARALGV